MPLEPGAVSRWEVRMTDASIISIPPGLLYNHIIGRIVHGFTLAPVMASVSQTTTDLRFLDGDIRNTRIRFDLSAGPVLGRLAPKATLEADFFGAINGTPPFGDEQPQLRARFAYVDLTNGHTTLRVGQFWAPLFGELPVSVTHLAFPLGYGATGMIGWRFPGGFLYHALRPGQPPTVQLQLALLKGSGPAVGLAASGAVRRPES